MWKNNRPDDWKNGWDKEREEDGMLSKAEIYEAGADALWNALWKMAEESPTKTFTIDSQVVNVFEEEQNVLQT